MLRPAVHAFGAFRPLTRVVTSITLPVGPEGAPDLARKCTTPADSVAESLMVESPESPAVAKSKPPLPAAPETPLSEYDPLQYLQPLYEHGWRFANDPMRAPSSEHGPAVLRRSFSFPSVRKLAAFTENTRDVSYDIVIFPDLVTKLDLRTPNGTRSLVRLALEVETKYQKICPQLSFLEMPPIFTAESPVPAQALAKAIEHFPLPKPTQLVPIASVPLPSPPSATFFFPRSITEADLATYITPLIMNGWYIKSIPITEQFSANHLSRNSRWHLKRKPSLHRVYRFQDYASARDFFRAVVPAIPAPAPNSVAGVQMALFMGSSMVKMWSISHITEDAVTHNTYGISRNDVRFAIQVEAEFNKNWTGKADNVAALPRAAPTTMEQVWNFRK
ncbi:hypothetical protein B0H17DRAFT_1066461 [Mycena rosella]|uniref:Uncharacterized protein n=1 Tax=Mycena rosella TaxID=1033263 RepID=A0AAD7DE01_MYCRO|nr:hypothetical protein B0H17DRAFT_1066461 [Mycena rosella]